MNHRLQNKNYQISKKVFSDENKPISQLIGKDEELRKKWLRFVVDKIGTCIFNKMYVRKDL